MSGGPMILSEGDTRYGIGQRVEIVVVLMDKGVTRVHPALADILAVHTERCGPNNMDVSDTSSFISSDCLQFQFAKKKPPAILHHAVNESSPNTKKELKSLQRRVVGYDVQLISPIPWSINDVPAYYYPNVVEYRACMFNGYDGSVNIIYVPARHVIRDANDDSSLSMFAMDATLNKFYRRAPYKWVVLYNEAESVSLEEAKDVQNAVKQFFAFNYDDDNSSSQEADKEKHEEKPQKQEKKPKKFKTRRVVGEVVDFGVDYDNVPKLIVSLRNAHKEKPKLDDYLFHGPFAEVARRNCDLHLYKLPYAWVHDAFDELTLGRQTYVSVLKHILCDTLQRFRIKTIKFPEPEKGSSDETTTEESKSPESQEKSKRKNSGIFYYGFTEDGYHFSKNNRHVLSTDIPELSEKQNYNDEYETRSTLFNNQWLNMRRPNPDEKVDFTIRRGYIIYGRIVEKHDRGQVTLDWCTPAPGIDLLRVYLATNGKSPIFKKLSKEEIREKLLDKNGNDTLASKLFDGIIDHNASNDAISYVRNELMWAQKNK